MAFLTPSQNKRMECEVAMPVYCAFQVEQEAQKRGYSAQNCWTSHHFGTSYLWFWDSKSERKSNNGVVK
jgi:hypothetical protein